MKIHRKTSWNSFPASDLTPEATYLSKVVATALFLAHSARLKISSVCPAQRNEQFALDRRPPLESTAEKFDKYLECTPDVESVRRVCQTLKTDPWTIEIARLDTLSKTFWHQVEPMAYEFVANVDPNVHHPQWSQECECMLGTPEKRQFQMYNGYRSYVGYLARS